MTPRDDKDAEIPAGRRALIRHVLKVQRDIRTCTDCGLCCTEAHNSVRIDGDEAARIARWLETRGSDEVEVWRQRLQQTVQRFSLRAAAKKNYTCAFLEPDLTCALPMHIKPVACLAFNPLTPDHCDQEPEWYERGMGADAPGRAPGKPLSSIPVAVLRALDPAGAPRRKAPRRRR